MEHSFDIKVAKEVGVVAAVIYNNIRHWCRKNKANEKNFYEGKYWTYNSKRALTEIFDYLSYSQIKTSLMKLEENGFIGKGNFNDNPYDRTNWYCDLHQELSTGEKSPKDRIEITNETVLNSQCITDNKQYINTDNNIYTHNKLFEEEIIQPKQQKEEVNKKGGRSREKFDLPEFRQELLNLGAEEQHVDDWIEVRRKMKAVFTKTALDGFIRESTKARKSIKEAVQLCAEKGWRGIDSKWFQEEIKSNEQNKFEF